MLKYHTLAESLNAKKERLFKQMPKDLSKWEIPASKMREAIAVSHNAELAYKIMLPEETKKLNYLQD